MVHFNRLFLNELCIFNLDLLFDIQFLLLLDDEVFLFLNLLSNNFLLLLCFKAFDVISIPYSFTIHTIKDTWLITFLLFLSLLWWLQRNVWLDLDLVFQTLPAAGTFEWVMKLLRILLDNAMSATALLASVTVFLDIEALPAAALLASMAAFGWIFFDVELLASVWRLALIELLSQIFEGTLLLLMTLGYLNRFYRLFIILNFLW